MRTLFLSGLAIALSGAAAPALATGGAGAMAPPMAARGAPASATMAAHRWGPRMQGRWYAGQRAPGGWVAYRRPARGFVLPGYWIQPSFYIANYGLYGLSAPRPGFGWSRYYDDAVLTDSYGRVYDSRRDIAWDRYEGGYADDGYYDEGDARDHAERRDTGVGGAAIGAVVGGVIGNRVAGRGNRTVGTLVGAGVGAVAGLAIDKAEDSGSRRLPPPPPGGPRPYDGPPQGGPAMRDDGVTYNNDYSGRWVGTWHGDDGRTYSGEYSGTYDGTTPPPRYDRDRDGPRDRHPHWSRAPEMGPPPAVYGGGGYYYGGYYYPAPTITTITIQPTVTTTRYVEETVTYVSTRHRTRRAWKPRPRCGC